MVFVKEYESGVVILNPPLDLHLVPVENGGRWVVGRRSTREPIGYGDSLSDALSDAGMPQTVDDLEASDLVVGVLPRDLSDRVKTVLNPCLFVPYTEREAP